jgi:ABC-2 type transport system permease protein
MSMSLAWPSPLRQAYLSYKGHFLWLNWPAYLSNVVIRPALMVTMFGLTGRFARGEDAAVALVIGMSVFSLLNILMGGILQGFYYERSFGTLSLWFASSGSKLRSFLTRSVLHYPNALLCVVCGLGWAALVLGMELGPANRGGVAAGFCIISLSAMLFGLFLGNLVIVFRNWAYFMGLTQTAFIALGGLVIPRDDLPAGLRQLSDVIPVAHGLEGVREAFAGASLGAISGYLALELLVGLCYGTAGFLLFRALELHASTGAYEMI